MTRHLRRTLALLPALVLAAPIAAHRPAEAQMPAGLERARAALPAEAARELERIVGAAREQGLPTEPLVSKALEGAAKGVPADRVLAVVRQRVDQLGRARALLADGPPAATASDLTAVADALQRGVPDEAIRGLRSRARPDEPVALAVLTLGDLLDGGVPVDVALDVLEAWRSRGADTAELAELPAAVERLIRQGVLPDQAAAAVASAVRAGRGPAGAGPPPGVDPPGLRRGGPPDRPPIPPGGGPPDGRGRGRPGAR